MLDVSRQKMDQAVKRFDGRQIQLKDVVPYSFDCNVLEVSFEHNDKLVLYFAFPKEHNTAEIAKALVEGQRRSPHVVQINVKETVLVWGAGMCPPPG